MRRSTHPRTSPVPTAASPGSGPPRPRVSPHGHFELLCSDGQCLTNRGQDRDFRLYRHPVSYDPDVWYADFNQDGSPHTLRIYRLTPNHRLQEVYKYTYIPETCSWKPTRPNPPTSDDNQNNPPRWQPNLVIAPLLAVFRWLARWLLWPIADFNWREKLVDRQRLLGLTPIEPHFMNEQGFLTLVGDRLKSVQLRYDGSVRVNDRVLRRRDAGTTIPTLDEFGNKKDWIEWYGDVLIIKGHDSNAILSYEFGYWQQWAVHRHSLIERIGCDLDIARRTGEAILRQGFSICWNAAVIFIPLLILIYVLFAIYSDQQ